jgi:hypothetical protein
MTRKTVGALAALAALSAGPALAQAAAPAAASAQASVQSNLNAKLSVESSPIETIAADPEGKAAMEKVLPGITSHPAYDQFKAFTLSQIQPMSEGAITPDHLKAIQAELDKISK